MVHYTYDPRLIEIREIQNETDVTFTFALKTEEMRNRLKQIRSLFEENRDYTDALFYSHEDGTYEVIVRHDARLSFLLQAFRFRFLETLSWKEQT